MGPQKTTFFISVKSPAAALFDSRSDLHILTTWVSMVADPMVRFLFHKLTELRYFQFSVVTCRQLAEATHHCLTKGRPTVARRTVLTSRRRDHNNKLRQFLSVRPIQ